MDIRTIMIVLSLIILAALIWVVFKIWSARRRTILTTVIDIFASGSYHVEYLPPVAIKPFDLIQIAISYISKIHYLTKSDTQFAREHLDNLLQTAIEVPFDIDSEMLRARLRTLSPSNSKSANAHGIRTVGVSERFLVRLIRGKNFDYILNEFNMVGYKPNICTSAVLLFCNVAGKLDESHLRLLHESLVRFIMALDKEPLTLTNNGLIAFGAVDYTIRQHPEFVPPNFTRFRGIRE